MPSARESIGRDTNFENGDPNRQSYAETPRSNVQYDSEEDEDKDEDNESVVSE